MRRRSIVVATHGAFVGKTGKRIVVRTRSGGRAEYPAREVDLLLVTARGVTVSAEALRLAVESGVPVFFAYPSGYPYAAVMPVVSTGSADTRREQILAKYDERGTELAREFVRGKLRNQAGLLRSAAASRRRTSPAEADELAGTADKILKLAEEAGSVSGALDSGAAKRLRSIESEAARAYWAAFSLMVPRQLGFPGRVTLGAEDLVNSLLNYGYGVLRARVSAAVFFAGLDLHAGFLHVDRAGRPSLALDMM
ncbi:MAG: CRISPR-associated endonuclease Cas1, partial [Candidatus Korarchaeota archaeon]|nr:CRISPR-associated endonuclease Cas1 [Candidatus Korarchaeota archaeon]